MALPKWNLTQEQVFRANELGLRIMMAVLLKALIDGTPDRERAAAELSQAAETVIASLPAFEAVPAVRFEEYRRCATDAAQRLVANALSIRKIELGSTRH